MANTKIPSYKEINNAIKKIADIPSRVDDEGYIIADGVSLTKNVYDPKNGDYELHIRDKKNNKWQSFDTEDGADCVERAAKCFVDFYNANHKSESHKFNCSMQKKKESLSKKQEADEGEGLEDQPEEVQAMVKELAEETGNDIENVEIGRYATKGRGISVAFGDEEYVCYATYEDAEEASNEGVKDLLDDIGISGIRFENIGGIEEYVDTDWFEDAAREDAEYYVSDLKESDPEQYKEEFGDLDEEDAAEKLFVNMGEDYVEWFKENFGEKELEQVIKQNNLVDYDKLAEAITEADGPANELASYDGVEIELPCGYYCYRCN